MCGIVYCLDLRPGKRKKGVNYKVQEIFRKQRTRGLQGFGYFAPESNRFVHHTQEGRILALLRREKEAKEILFHHRNPTSTKNTYSTAHPISTKKSTDKGLLDYLWIGVHNGWINNHTMIRHAHERLGMEYVTKEADVTYNDSESLVYDLALFFEGKQERVDATGAAAWIMMQIDPKTRKPVKLHFGRNGNPLNIHRKNGKFLTLSSQGPGVSIEADTHYVYDYEKDTYEKTPLKIHTSAHSWASDREPVTFRPELKEHNYEYTANTTINRALAGHKYTNGEFDASGVWFPKREIGFVLPGGTEDTTLQELVGTALDVEEMQELAGFVTTDVVENIAREFLRGAKMNQRLASRIAKGKTKKSADKVRALKAQLETRGTLFLDHDDFTALDTLLFDAQLELYGFYKAGRLLQGLASDELLTMIGEVVSEEIEEAQLAQEAKA